MINDCYRPDTSKVIANVGNLGEDYKYTFKDVNNIELIVTPNLILKNYTMHISNRAYPVEMLCDESDFIEGQICIGKIKPFSGLGFVILSDDMINVARWDEEVIKNQLYGYEKGRPSFATPLDIREDGSFCVWELGIVNHEREAWKRFLDSQRTDKDKEAYLDDIMPQGIL